MKTFEGNIYSMIYDAAARAVDFMHYAMCLDTMSDSEIYDDAGQADIRELMFFTDQFPSMRCIGTSPAIHELARHYGLSVDVVKTLSKVKD